MTTSSAVSDATKRSGLRAARNRRPRLLLLAVLLAWSLSVADFYIVNVALPTIGRSIGAGSAELELIVAGYSAAYACLLVTGGRLGDRWGRRRMLVLGMSCFLASSTVCAVAMTGPELVVARLGQGASAAVMAPQVLATIQATFDGHERQRALGALGMTVGISTVSGQLLGAVMSSADLLGLSWRPAFLLNLPVGGVGLVLVLRHVPRGRSHGAPRLDVRGAVLLAVAIAAVLLPLSLGRQSGWPVWCWPALAGAAAAAWAFAAWQQRLARRSGAPLVPPSILAARGLRFGLAVVMAFFLGAGGFFLTMAETLQAGRGFSPLWAGMILLPYATGFLVASRSASALVSRFGPSVVVAGATVTAAGFAAAGALSATDYGSLSLWSFAPVLAVIGMAHGFVMIPLFGIILSTVRQEDAGAAGGVLAMTQQLGLSLGAAGLGALFFAVRDAQGFGAATTGVFVAESVLAVVTAVGAARLGRDGPG